MQKLLCVCFVLLFQILQKPPQKRKERYKLKVVKSHFLYVAKDLGGNMKPGFASGIPLGQYSMHLEVYLNFTTVSIACSSTLLMFYKLYQGTKNILKTPIFKERRNVRLFKINVKVMIHT